MQGEALPHAFRRRICRRSLRPRLRQCDYVWWNWNFKLSWRGKLWKRLEGSCIRERFNYARNVKAEGFAVRCSCIFKYPPGWESGFASLNRKTFSSNIELWRNDRKDCNIQHACTSSGAVQKERLRAFWIFGANCNWKVSYNKKLWASH